LATPTDEPPADLPAPRADELRTTHTDVTLWRIYSTADHPMPWNGLRHFGPVSSRWEPHPPGPLRVHPDRAVHYTATGIVAAAAEVFQQHRTIVRSPDMMLVAYRLGRSVRLLDANSRWFTRAGASQAIVYGDPLRSSRWATAIADSYPHLDGVVYRSKLDPVSTCVALWLPAADALAAARPALNISLAHPGLRGPLDAAAIKIGYDVAD
jgi:hypothetical protein